MGFRSQRPAVPKARRQTVKIDDFFAELKRRNVKVAIAYAVLACLLMQVT